jgi:hypothetical protein
MVRRQIIVLVAKMILAELPGSVTKRLQRLSYRDVSLLKTNRRTQRANLREPRPYRRLPGDKRRSSGGAAILCIVVGEGHPFFTDAVNVGGRIADQSMRIAADVRLSDVIAEDDEDVWFFACAAALGPNSAAANPTKAGSVAADRCSSCCNGM